MPRPRQYDSDAQRARAWRQRRAEELRSDLARRLREADDETIERLVGMVPMPALMRLDRALEWAEHPERAPEHCEHRHGPRRHGHPHHHGHGPLGHRGRRRQYDHLSE